MGWEGLDPQSPCRVAHPLWAALARDLNPPGVRTVPAGQPDILAAQWHAGEAPVLTAAANPAVGLEGLPIPVLAAVHLTAAVILSPEAHGPPATGARPQLADQALAGVTDVEMVAGLPKPPCTYPAAVAAVQHQGYPQWASGWWPGAGTRCWAQLGTHL